MTCREYHNATKHSVESLRRSRRLLDWANMPDPFRHYEGVPVLDLPAQDVPPAVEAAGSLKPNDGPTFLSQLLFHSAAISATKIAPSGARYALRVNPSSGNLHPTEFHFITRGLTNWPDGLYHYRPSDHMAEQRLLGTFPGNAPVTFCLSSIEWREAWKYGPRAYRYCLLDIGHAWQALAQAADAMGCKTQPNTHITFDYRLNEDEKPMLELDIHLPSKPDINPNFAHIARTRRSALDFVGGDRSISSHQLAALLEAVASVEREFVQLYLYIHRVEGLERGIYSESLELIRPGDQRVAAAGLSLGQDLAGNACIAFSMIGALERAAQQHGELGYRLVHFEAGAIGHRLYLAAESVGLRGTGIGAFFDDRVNEYLNLARAQGEVVYHFAVGYPIQDTRLEVTPEVEAAGSGYPD